MKMKEINCSIQMVMEQGLSLVNTRLFQRFHLFGEAGLNYDYGEYKNNYLVSNAWNKRSQIEQQLISCVFFLILYQKK